MELQLGKRDKKREINPDPEEECRVGECCSSALLCVGESLELGTLKLIISSVLRRAHFKGCLVGCWRGGAPDAFYISAKGRQREADLPAAW